ncbi:hypothetical protein AGMMS50268_04830 [Spirochaetia bacterium]|nr:hypothetical protein AGMMS50268_04830 [Spirochaetia bacterium]
MKKLQFKGILAVTFVLVLGLMFAGCSNGGGDFTPTVLDGEWHGTSEYTIGSNSKYETAVFFQSKGFTVTRVSIVNNNFVEEFHNGSFVVSGGGTSGSVTFTQDDGFTWSSSYSFSGSNLNLNTGVISKYPNNVVLKDGVLQGTKPALSNSIQLIKK